MSKADFPLMRHYSGVEDILDIIERHGYGRPSLWTVRSWLYRFKRIPEQYWWCFMVDLQQRGIFFREEDFVRLEE